MRVVFKHHGNVRLSVCRLVNHTGVNLTSPQVMSSSPAIMRSKFDLPEPDGPTLTINLWLAMAEVMP